MPIVSIQIHPLLIECLPVRRECRREQFGDTDQISPAARSHTDQLAITGFARPDRLRIVIDNSCKHKPATSDVTRGEEGYGDILIEICDPRVVVAYAVEAASIFDHYLWRAPQAGEDRRRQDRFAVSPDGDPAVRCDVRVDGA